VKGWTKKFGFIAAYLFQLVFCFFFHQKSWLTLLQHATTHLKIQNLLTIQSFVLFYIQKNILSMNFKYK